MQEKYNSSYYRKRWRGRGNSAMRKTMQDVVNWYLVRMGLFGLSHSDQKMKYAVGQRIIQEMGKKYLSAAPLRGVPRLTRDDVALFRAKLISEGKRDTTIARYLTIGTTMINKVNKQMDWSLPNPFEGATDGLVYEPREREITGDEQTAILFGLKGVYRDVLLVMLESGMRIGEVTGLTWDRVDLKTGWVSFGKLDNKSRRPRKVALSDKAVEIMSKQPRTRQWVFVNRGAQVRYQAFWRAFEKAKEKVAPDCTSHDFRRTYGYRARRAGVDLDDLQVQLGHKSRSTTERIYAKLDEERARNAVLVRGKAI